MKKGNFKTYQNVCPRSCPSSCTMITRVEKDKISSISADINNKFTKGKLCAKGFSYKEENSHPNRIKYPYYQKVKGSRKFERISWDDAFQLIIKELKKIKEENNSFKPFGLYKGTGNVGIHHFVLEDFFSALGDSTIIKSSATLLNDLNLHLDKLVTYDLQTIVNSSLIIIWGANPAASNIHLIPYIIDAKLKGAKVIIIDPLYNQSTIFADLFLQLKPNRDSLLLFLLIKSIINDDPNCKQFVQQNRDYIKFENIFNYFNDSTLLEEADLKETAFQQFAKLYKEADEVTFIFGTGILKHANNKTTIKAIKLLFHIQQFSNKKTHLLYHKQNKLKLFRNEQELIRNNNLTITNVKQLNYADEKIEALWISCSNPLVQEINLQAFWQLIERTPFVVTVDRFFTKTAEMSNLILPTTTHFEESDVIVNQWFGQLLYNEKAVQAYYESKSDFTIMNELAKRINSDEELACKMPTYESEDHYLDEQFTNDVKKHYNISNLADLKLKGYVNKLAVENLSKETINFPNEHEVITQFNKLLENKQPALGQFWLITSHHPYMLNSQFHFLNLDNEDEIIAFINEKIATEKKLNDGQLITIYNREGSINAKAILTNNIPCDIIQIYNGFYKNSDFIVNKLMSEWQSIYDDPSSENHLYAFFDTFVNIK